MNIKSSAFALLTVLGATCVYADNAEVLNRPFVPLRSADPCEQWVRWQDGTYPTRMPHLRDGTASHLTPAEIVVYSAMDASTYNPATPVNALLLITYMHFSEVLYTRPHEKGFEEGLFFATGYYPQLKEYRGFFPQVSGLAFQISREQWSDRKLSFEEFHAKHFGDIPLQDFRVVYARYAKILGATRKGYGTEPDFTSFTKLSVAEVQRFFLRTASTLGFNLFTMRPKDTRIYVNPAQYCEE